jgi:hypothetical protein
MSSNITVSLKKTSKTYLKNKNDIIKLFGTNSIKNLKTKTKVTITPNHINNIVQSFPLFNNKNIIHIKKYSIKLDKGNKKNSGTYGDIHTGVILNNINKKKVIIKYQDIEKSSRKKVAIIEILIHIILRSDKTIARYIPTYYGTFRDKNKIGIVMQFLGETNFQKYIKKDILSTKQLSSLILQLTLLLESIQLKFDMVHGDLKTNNIMVFKTKKKYIRLAGFKIQTYGYTLKLIDFGFSCLINDKVPISADSVNLTCGKKYIDLLFFIISFCITIDRKTIKHKKLLDFLIARINKLLHKLNIIKYDYLGIKNNTIVKANVQKYNNLTNKGIKYEKYNNFDMFYSGDHDYYLYYYIIELALKINNRADVLNHLKLFYPMEFFNDFKQFVTKNI